MYIIRVANRYLGTALRKSISSIQPVCSRASHAVQMFTSVPCFPSCMQSFNTTTFFLFSRQRYGIMFELILKSWLWLSYSTYFSVVQDKLSNADYMVYMVM